MDRVDEAFAAVPRRAFLPTRERERAEFDGPIPIGHGQTSSQPRTVTAMLRLLEVHRGQRVLDVGAGSGWTTALLAHLVGPAGRVTGLELVPELADWGAANLRAAGWDLPSVQLRRADPQVLGDPGGAPYDRILVSAMAPDLPTALADQLADPGRMVLPVRGSLTLWDRDGGRDTLTEHGAYRFVPLVVPRAP